MKKNEAKLHTPELLALIGVVLLACAILWDDAANGHVITLWRLSALSFIIAATCYLKEAASS